MSLPSSLDLPAKNSASGVVALPGSKSISNRTLLLSALASGVTRLNGLLESEDTEVMLAALSQLGVSISATHEVQGQGDVFPVKNAELFLGNAGTAFRPLAAVLALSGGDYVLKGVPRMHERPIGDLVDGLRQIGAQVEYLGQQGYPPLAIHPARLELDGPIRVRGDVSSQFLSALLMALPLLKKPSRIEVVGELISKPYVDLTLNLMARFGVKVRREGWSAFLVPQVDGYVSPGSLQVEGDASSASYFLAAGALAGGPVRVTGVGKISIQGDIGFADVLAQMGATVLMGDDFIEASAPPAGQRLRGLEIDCTAIPDAAMTLAVCALKTQGPTRLTGIASWRVKETDRIAAMATELRKLGAKVNEEPGAITIYPAEQLVAGVAIDTYNDHRMAMCFALVSLLGVPVTINNPACVAKTFPDFFERFSCIEA
jgi:3-phosphoshikimate 1-carboxyvinyltransferase